MKKIHLLLVLFSLLGWTQIRADVEIIATNFPDKNFRSYLLSQDYGSDELITDEEIASIYTISVANKGIQSLEGIKFFTALKSLVCRDNQLFALDVSGCTALRSLFCYNNQLTTLNVSGCTALKELFCYNNQLTTLNVSGCTALKELDCRENQLTTLNISGCTALTTLRCGYNRELMPTVCNQLTALDVSECTALKELECDGNQLTKLDVSGCTALERLYCPYNQLTALDVSGCTALTSLSCGHNQLTALNVSGCTALTSLYCSENQLTSLDVSKNTALTYLDCANNQLTALDVTNNTALTSLDCSQNQIKGVAMDALVASLPTQTYAYLGVIYNENEGNVMTTTQVAAAKAKGWKPKYYDGTDWKEYAGSDPTAIESIESDATASKNGSDVYFDLSGRRVMAPQKGIYVKNGQKVVVK